MATAKHEKPTTIRGGLSCPACFVILPAVYPFFEAYFRSHDVDCPGCKKQLPPLWDLALRTLQRDWSGASVFQLAGAKQTFASSWLKPDKVVQLNLNRWGIHKKAEILKEHYTTVGPEEGPFVVPLRYEPSTNVPQHLRLLYGATHGHKAPPRIKLLVSISWIVPGQTEVSVHHLVDAVRRSVGGRYDALTVPANVAVEAALTPVLRDWVTVFSNNWTGIAGRAAQMSVVSVIAADTLRVPRLDPKIGRLLDDLRNRRNEMGHSGRPDPKRPSLNATSAGELLTAAIFGFHYARFLRTAVSRLRRRRGLPPRGA